IEGLDEALNPYHPSKIISYLIGAFLHPKEEVRWKAIYAFGRKTALLAKEDLERARIVIRRLMWMLNEESGGMGWGVGEGFAEALYHAESLKKEYLQIYVSYIWPEGNYLEFPPAQRGILWGIGRLAQKYREDLIKISAQDYLIYHLSSKDELVVFFSLWGLLQFKEAIGVDKALIEQALFFLKQKPFQVCFFDGRAIKTYGLEDIEGLTKNF
ncbi:MAG: DVU0298 family protein, partial [Caldimicrobium sp.]